MEDNNQPKILDINQVFANIDYVCSQAIVKREDHNNAILGIEALKNTYNIQKDKIIELEEKVKELESLLNVKK